MRITVFFLITALFGLLPVFADTLLQQTVTYITALHANEPKTFETVVDDLEEAHARADISPEIKIFLGRLLAYTATLQTQNQPLYTVTKIVDGDTIRLLKNGDEVTIRMIGIDAPESTTTRYGYVECFGKEARTHLQTLIGTWPVALAFDRTQGATDKYGRLLAYVFAGNTNINQQMLADGYAREYTYNLPYQYQDEFQDAQRDAKDTEKGLRNTNACSGTRSEAEKTGTDSENNDISETDVTCGNKRYCNQMSSCDEARFYLNACGLERLDSDGDGMPCEDSCNEDTDLSR